MTRISLNVIVYNEESRLENCLLDARDHVDEIVVVDQMSTDRTPEIAERLADVYIRDVHHGHAEPSPELAASRSSGDWILILDADENMSDLLKAQLRQLVAGDKDGYWIRKENLVDGAVTGRVDHLRLVRKSRASFDPGPHGGARSVTENVDTFEQIGILHEKSLGEQIFDDARYEQMAYEEDAPTSSKRNWLQHNYALRAQRGGRRRTDLELLVPAGARAVLVVGDVRVEFEGASVRQVDSVLSTAPGAAVAPAPTDGTFDAAVVVLPAAEPLARWTRFGRSPIWSGPVERSSGPSPPLATGGGSKPSWGRCSPRGASRGRNRRAARPLSNRRASDRATEGSISVLHQGPSRRDRARSTRCQMSLLGLLRGGEPSPRCFASSATARWRASAYRS